jgi:hypothetical protein
MQNRTGKTIAMALVPRLIAGMADCRIRIFVTRFRQAAILIVA